MMVKAVLTGLLFVLLVVLWPLVYWISNFVWFGAVDSVVTYELIVFIPMGVISALAVTIPHLSQKYSGCLMAGIIGYIIATPIAYFTSLYGGLVLDPWLATTVFGSLPLLVFTFIGYKIGEKIYTGSQVFHHY